MEASGRSFAEEAARVSLGAAFALMVLSAFLRKILERMGLPLVFPFLSLVLCAIGFGLGGWALFAVRQFGTRRILTYAIGGIFFNGLLFVWWLGNLSPLLAARHVTPGDLTGHWRLQHIGDSAASDQIKLALHPDHSFQLDKSAPRGSVSMKGKWWINGDRKLMVQREETNDRPAVYLPGTPISLGTVRSVSVDRFSLTGRTGEDDFERIPSY